MESISAAFDAMEVFASDLVELPDIRRSEVGQLGVFEVIPQLFDGIQFRCVGRQPLQLQSGEPPKQLTNRLAFMHIAPIPQHDDRPPQVAEQRPQEICGAHVVDILLGICAKPKRDSLSARRQTESCRQRDFVTMRCALPQDGRLSGRREAATDQRGQQEPTFVDQYKTRTLRNGAF